MFFTWSGARPSTISNSYAGHAKDSGFEFEIIISTSVPWLPSIQVLAFSFLWKCLDDLLAEELVWSGLKLAGSPSPSSVTCSNSSGAIPFHLYHICPSTTGPGMHIWALLINSLWGSRQWNSGIGVAWYFSMKYLSDFILPDIIGGTGGLKHLDIHRYFCLPLPFDRGSGEWKPWITPAIPSLIIAVVFITSFGDCRITGSTCCW